MKDDDATEILAKALYETEFPSFDLDQSWALDREDVREKYMKKARELEAELFKQNLTLVPKGLI